MTIKVPVYRFEELLQPVDRVEVEMIGRLVEQQGLGLAEERLRQEHAHLLSALQPGHRAFVDVIRNVEPLEQHGRVALGRVTVFFADDAFELAETHAVVVCELRLGIERIALRQGVPEPLIPHDDGVDDTGLIERVLILPHHTQPARTDHSAALRLDLAREEAHERGFARAVRTGQAVASARRERRGDILEQELRTEPHGHAAD